jgi:hypothetical protein
MYIDLLVKFKLPASSGPLFIASNLEPKEIFARLRCYFIFYKQK